MNEEESIDWLFNGLKTMGIISIIAIPFFVAGILIGEKTVNYNRCYAFVNGEKISFNSSIEFNEKYENITNAPIINGLTIKIKEKQNVLNTS